MWQINFKSTFSVTLLLIIPTVSLFAQKDDTLRLNNNDRITGEIKKLEYGILNFKTSDIGTLNVEWEKIKSIKTKKFFEIYLEDNSKYFGTIDSTFTNSPRIRQLMRMEGTDRYLDLIIKVNPIKKRFLDRIDINLEIGYQYNKGSNVSNFNTGYNFYYRDIRNSYRFNGSNYITDQRNENQQFKKQDINLTYNHYMKRSWRYGVFSTAEQNTELGLELRLLIGADIGKALVQSEKSELELVGGILGNTEESTENTQTKNIEGKIQMNYRYFIFHNPELSIVSDITAYPSMNVAGRYRIVANFKTKIEIISDLYFNLTFYDNFDSKPPSTTAEKNDWGINTSVSYSF